MTRPPIPMRRVRSLGDFSEPRVPGEFAITLEDQPWVYLSFICPLGCAQPHTVPIGGHPQAWEWNGDQDRPTLSPSLLDVRGCRWHGFVTAGELVTCGDSP